MENASKALIIAGAILLSILLITLGIYIFTQAQSVIQGSGMTQTEISTFNSQFLKYEGSKKGSEIKSLIQEVNINNSQDESKERQVEIETAGGKVTIGEITTGTGDDAVKNYATSNIKNPQPYTVSITEYAKDGRITKIKVE